MAFRYHLPRIASRMKFLVGSIIQREIKDPRVGLVTVLNVEPSQDLKEARVYVSIFGSPGVQSRTIRALESARGFIQKEVGKHLDTRNTPRLSFIVDSSLEKVSRIEALMDQTREEREDPMAKKPGKKDGKSGKGKPSKASQRPERASPTKPVKEPKLAKDAVKKGTAKGGGEIPIEAPAIRTGKPGRPPKRRPIGEEEGFSQSEKPFGATTPDMGEEEEEFIDEFDSRGARPTPDEEAENDEEEEEEEDYEEEEEEEEEVDDEF